MGKSRADERPRPWVCKYFSLTLFLPVACDHQARLGSNRSRDYRRLAPRPVQLVLGRCVGAWAEPDNYFSLGSACHGEALPVTRWLANTGVIDAKARQQLIPHGGPWWIDPDTD